MSLTFLRYSLFTSSQGIFPLGENIEAFQSAPLATITDEAPVTGYTRENIKITQDKQVTNNDKKDPQIHPPCQ